MTAFKLCLALLAVAAVKAAVPEDEIIDLPGLDYEINFKHYSGYLDGSPGDHLHYWLTESQNDPSTDPVLLWLNGGPGCSSMMGLLTELGPYRVKDDGSGLKENPYGWNLNANVLFLEAPRCVGFSYSDSGACVSSDDSTSLSNYRALQDFFNKFPEYRKNEFYITGESYGGIYIPTLSMRVLWGNDTFPLNFKGFAIGNGLLSYEQNDNSLLFFGEYHDLLGETLWDRLVTNCCDKQIPDQADCHFDYSSGTTQACILALNEAFNIIYNGGLNIYNLYGECAHPDAKTNQGLTRREVSLKHLFRSMPKENRPDTRSEVLCEDNTGSRTYLNDPDTRKAIHIPDFVQDWDVCASIYYTSQYDSVLDLVKNLTSANLRGLIYNGDVDMSVNVIGNSWGVEALGLEIKDDWGTWMGPTNQVDGFRIRYKNLDFVTIRGAGHMVPEDKPVEALQMITAYLDGTDYGL